MCKFPTMISTKLRQGPLVWQVRHSVYVKAPTLSFAFLEVCGWMCCACGGRRNVPCNQIWFLEFEDQMQRVFANWFGAVDVCLLTLPAAHQQPRHKPPRTHFDHMVTVPHRRGRIIIYSTWFGKGFRACAMKRHGPTGRDGSFIVLLFLSGPSSLLFWN